MKEIKVLIAEDEVLIADFFMDCISDFFNGRLRFNFTHHTNGVQALQDTIKQKFDIIFTDINMPYMDGVEFIKRTKSKENLNNDTPIIAISAYPGNIDFNEDNLVYIMKKPIDPSRLEKVCKLVLAKHLRELNQVA